MNRAIICGLLETMGPYLRAAGAHKIATVLRQHNWDVEVLDFFDQFTLEQRKELLKSRIDTNTRFIGFSSFFRAWDHYQWEIAKWLKDTYPDIKIIYGNSDVPQPPLPTQYIDYFVGGYGEVAILEICKEITGNGANLKFDQRFNGTDFENKVIDAINDYPAFPSPSLLTTYEKRDFIEPWEWLTTEWSRGCKFQCKYCNYPILGVKDDHSRQTEDYIYHLKRNYDEWGVTSYSIADETMNQDKAMIKRFAEAVDKEIDFKITQHGFARADLLVSNEDTWDPLIKLGAVGHFYGVETFHKKAGSAIGKGMNPERLKEGLLKVKKYFGERSHYRGQIALIFGLPYEPMSSMIESCNWLKQNWSDQSSAFAPLEIPLNPNLGRTNYFTNTWERFGYRKIDIGKDRSSVYKDYGRTNTGLQLDVLIWENDYTNWYEAMDFAEEMFADIQPQKESPWVFLQYARYFNGDISKIHQIEKYDKETQTACKNSNLEFLEKYFNQKINWIKK